MNQDKALTAKGKNRESERGKKRKKEREKRKVN